MSDYVSNKDLYAAIMDVHKKIDEIVDKRITPMELRQENLMGKIAVIGSLLVISITLITDWIRNKFLKNL